MKRILFLFVMACVLTTGAVKAADVLNVVDLNVTMVNQDPYIAGPESYVNLLFKLENDGTQTAKNVTFELMPRFPFSLDPGEAAVKELGNVGSLLADEDEYYLVKYKVRVDKDALDGETPIEVRYKHDDAAGYFTQTFHVTISDPKTDFDVVLQDSSESSITLALANIGTNAAYSVTVRVPEQEDFRVTGISSSILGNLNSADYTLVTFDIVPNYQAGVLGRSEEQTLQVEVFYTDTIGVRRVVQKEVPITGYSGYANPANVSGDRQIQIVRYPRGDTTQGLLYIGVGIIGVGGIAGFSLYRRHKKKKK
jgi:hypothetical protein